MAGQRGPGREENKMGRNDQAEEAEKGRKTHGHQSVIETAEKRAKPGKGGEGGRTRGDQITIMWPHEAGKATGKKMEGTGLEQELHKQHAISAGPTPRTLKEALWLLEPEHLQHPRCHFPLESGAQASWELKMSSELCF